MTKYFFWIVVRLLTLVVLIFLSCTLYYKGYYITSGFLGLIGGLFILEICRYINSVFIEIQKVVREIYYDDYSLQIPKKLRDAPVFNQLHSLYKKEKKNHLEKQSLQLIYDNIINSLDIGIMILRWNNEQHREVYLINDFMQDTLGLPMSSKWQFYSDKVPTLFKLLENKNFDTLHQTVSIIKDGGDAQTFSLKTSSISTYEHTYYVIALDSVQNILDKKEKQVWFDLMKTLSHEILNTLTPIQSLIESTYYLSNIENWTNEDKEDFKLSMEMIKKKNQHLLTFVDNYRQLSTLPQPTLQNIDIHSFIEDMVRLTESMLSKKNITLSTDIDSKDLIFLFDPKLIERVLINLITNSIHALDDISNKTIVIRVYSEKTRKYISVSDNGRGIDSTIKSKIFIPFFTTRNDGSGIGLSISKSIMEAHGGYLTLQSKENRTVFTLCFV